MFTLLDLHMGDFSISRALPCLATHTTSYKRASFGWCILLSDRPTGLIRVPHVLGDDTSPSTSLKTVGQNCSPVVLGPANAWNNAI